MVVVLHTDSLMVSLDQRPHFTDGERGAQVGRWEVVKYTHSKLIVKLRTEP